MLVAVRKKMVLFSFPPIDRNVFKGADPLTSIRSFTLSITNVNIRRID